MGTQKWRHKNGGAKLGLTDHPHTCQAAATKDKQYHTYQTVHTPTCQAVCGLPRLSRRHHGGGAGVCRLRVEANRGGQLLIQGGS